MASVGWALLILLVGYLAGAVCVFIVGFAGAPGAVLSHAGQKSGNRFLSGLGFAICAAGQAYVVVGYAALVISQARSLVAERDLSSWIILGAAAMVASVPAVLVGKDSLQARREGNATAQHRSADLTMWASSLGIIALLISPTVARPWAWIPGVATTRPEPREKAPSRFEPDRERLTDAFAAFNQASKLSQLPEGVRTAKADPAKDAAVIAQIRAGLKAGEGISAEYLDWLHPEMRKHFSNYLTGQRLYLEGLTEGSVTKQVRGIQTIEQWSEFWDRNGSAIADRAFDS